MIIDYFIRQRAAMQITGKSTEYFVLTRASKSGSKFQTNSVFKALCEDGTSLKDGDVIVDGSDKYFAVAVRPMAFSTEALLYKANATVSIVSIDKSFNDKMVQIGMKETSVAASIPAMQETITAAMRQFEPGLLPTTTKRFVIAKCSVKLLDRIKLGSENYQVDAIDDSTYPGLLWVQTSIDKRVV